MGRESEMARLATSSSFAGTEGWAALSKQEPLREDKVDRGGVGVRGGL